MGVETAWFGEPLQAWGGQDGREGPCWGLITSAAQLGAGALRSAGQQHRGSDSPGPWGPAHRGGGRVGVRKLPEQIRPGVGPAARRCGTQLAHRVPSAEREELRVG